jgi:hypothetical protein
MSAEDPAAGSRVLLDGHPGTIVRSYDSIGEGRGYDVDLDNGEKRWVSHAGARTRLKDLPAPDIEIDWYALSNGLPTVMPDGALVRGLDEGE